MAKRIADKELTDRNWDQEEEGEEAGQFSIASQDVLKSRVVKRAKRRNVGAEGENSGAFKGFKGFSLAKPAASSDSPSTMFSGFGNGGGGFQGLGTLSNGNGSSSPFGGFSAPAASTGTTGLTFNGPSPVKPFAEIIAKQLNGSAPSPAPIFGIISGGSKEYSRQLTALNCSVRDWITKHVNDNPLCDLNPIFRDYEQHLASIERQYGAGAAAAAGGSEEKKQAGTPASPPPPPRSFSSSSSPAAPAPAATLFSFGKQSTDDSTQDNSSSTAPIPSGITFNFGKKVDSSVLGSSGSKSMSPGFSFSSSSSASFSQTSVFGAPGSAALSFSGTKAVDAPPAVENGEEESEEPPVPEVKEVKEDDAFLSKKCKMFYKKDSEFKEKGVGTLHLKHIEDGKTQLVIRADTSLGNILLNIMVSASMPCSRVGKNNVMVVCVPNPVIDDKNPTCPIPLLIRVKTSEEADELHKTLEENKA